MKIELANYMRRALRYGARQPPAAATDDHPIAHLTEIYKPKNISYFTHRGRYRPLAIMIETVNICDNDCIICPYSSQTRHRQTMPVDLFEKIIHDYADIGGGPVGLTPMVGEVFLDKHLLTRLEILKAAPSITAISAITNGSMLYRYDDQQLGKLVERFDRLTVSIYGLDAEEYATMTRRKHYDRMIEGVIRLLRMVGPENLQLSGRHLRARSQAEIDKWLDDIALRSGVNRAQMRFAGTLTYANWSFFDTKSLLPHDAIWRPVPDNKRQCALPLVSAQVLSDGTVSFCACADFNANTSLVLGNIRNEKLCDLLNSEKVRRLWNWAEHGVPDFCRHCSFHMPIEIINEIPSAITEPLATFGG